MEPTTRRATYVTDRYTSAWFRSRLKKLFEQAGIDVNIVSAAKVPSDPLPIISGSWMVPAGVDEIAVMPLNEPVAPEDQSWVNHVRFMISQSPHLSEYLAGRLIDPSVVIDHPLCWLPEDPGDLADVRPFKFLLPCYGEWYSDSLVKFLPYLVTALSKDLGEDMWPFEFVVESKPFEYRSSRGEKVTFYDDDGVFLHRLLRSAVVCCMAPSCLMEMSFLSRMSPLTGTALFSEGMIDSARRSYPVSVFDAFTRPRSYSHVKYIRAASGGIQMDDPDLSPLFNFCAGSRTCQSTSAVMTPSQVTSILSFGAGRSSFRSKEVDAALCGVRDGFHLAVEKLSKVYERLT